MSTISVPLSPELQERLDSLVAGGVGASRADVMRRALSKFAEDEAIRVVLEAEKEPVLRGNIQKLLEKM